MRIEYTCKDGSRTLALTPSMALMHWLGRSHPPPLIEKLQPFIVHVSPSPVPSEGNPMFMTLVFAEIERRWNKTPPFEAVPANLKKKGGGKKFQTRCLDVLRWLHAEGDITSLEVASKR
jgi:hypothetical protein